MANYKYIDIGDFRKDCDNTFVFLMEFTVQPPEGEIICDCINGLLTGCEGHTEKYRTAVFVHPVLARAVLKDQGPVFLSMAGANPVNKPFII